MEDKENVTLLNANCTCNYAHFFHVDLTVAVVKVFLTWYSSIRACDGPFKERGGWDGNSRLPVQQLSLWVHFGKNSNTEAVPKKIN